MIGPFAPRFSGQFTPATLSPTLLVDLATRVRAGRLLPHASAARNRYQVTRETASSLRFVAEGVLTHASVGLNDVSLELDPRDNASLRFEVSYAGWTRFVVVLSLGIMALAIASVVVISTFLPQTQWSHPEYTRLMWPMALFWGVLWPWILVAMHKPMARRLLFAILEQENGGEAATVAVPGTWRGTRRQSSTSLAGWPVWVIATGPDPDSGSSRGIARGWVAIGDVAVGALAIGGVAIGGIAIGGLSIGLLAIGGAAMGGLTLGGAALGIVAFGGLAVGWYAVGGAAIGVHAVGGGVVHLMPPR